MLCICICICKFEFEFGNKIHSFIHSFNSFIHMTPKLRYRIKCNSNCGHFEIQDGCHNRDLKIRKHRLSTLVLHIIKQNCKN